MIFFDSETTGKVGPTVLFQWAIDDGPVNMLHLWQRPKREYLQLIEMLVEHDVCAFNIAFDWFHVMMDYNVFRLMDDPDSPPTVSEYLMVQRRAVAQSLCVRPRSSLDLYLHAIKGPMQSLMVRDDIKIRKVPTPLADVLAAHLSESIDIDNIYFRRVGGKRWRVYPFTDRDTNKEDPNFKDVVLKWGAAAGLKPMVAHIFGIDVLDYPIPKHLMPNDDKKEWYPYHELTRWDRFIRPLVDYWATNKKALEYAQQDVEHLPRLYNHFGRPASGDDDSELAIAVACARMRGFSVDVEHAASLRDQAVELAASTPSSPSAVKVALMGVMTPMERLVLKNTSGKTLEAIARWDSPAGVLAKKIAQGRSAGAKARMLKKIVYAGAFHADYKIIGARSSRMSGTGGLNATGIEKEGETRACFPLHRPDEALDGGDFNAFEVTIADAVYQDPVLHEELRSGKKIHGLYGAQMFKRTYDDIMATKLMGSTGMYDRAKHGVFATMYFAMAQKLSITLGISLEEAEDGLQRWSRKYKKWQEAREATMRKFCSMRQERIGAKITWAEPADYAETKLGFRRYFTLQNRVCYALFLLGQRMPPEFKALGSFKVQRREGRIQTGLGASQTAIYSAAFQLQASNMRSAGNHEIQGLGGQITKRFQIRLWALQPRGIHPWRIQVMQVHDEVEACRSLTVDTTPVIQEALEWGRTVVPLLDIDWKTNVPHWGAIK